MLIQPTDYKSLEETGAGLDTMLKGLEELKDFHNIEFGPLRELVEVVHNLTAKLDRLRAALE